MKKLLSFLAVFVMCFSLVIQARNTFVTTKTDFTSAWASYQDGDTITIAYNKGVVLNLGTVNMLTTGGCVCVRGQYPDSLTTIQMSLNGVALTGNLTCGLIFENLHMQYKDPYATSGQVVYFNKVFANMTKLVFHNCEVSGTVRSLFRSVKPADATITSCGDIDYFEMSNCKVHNTFTSSGNNWPLVYFGHLPVEVVFRNNTFYDMPYIKSIFTIAYAAPDQGRNASIAFENNTVSLTGPIDAVISTGSFLGQEATFSIKNNVFIVPNWTNSLNLPDTSFTAPKIISAKYGMISASNNLVEGYKPWTAGQVIDDNGDGAFISLDTIPQYTMADLGVAWTDFTDPQNGKYSYLFTSRMATAGSTGGPIGDPRWVLTYTNPKTFAAKANIDGAVVSPVKGIYEAGSSIKVSASTVVGYSFTNWQDTLGNVLSTDNPYTFAINDNACLVAHYDALLQRKVAVSLKGTNTATCTISPARDTYYTGDILTTTVNTHAVNDFLGWSDGVTTLTRTDTLKADLTLTASFKQYPYLLAWDLCQLTANNKTFPSLTANHFIDSTNVGLLRYVSKDTISSSFQTRNNKFQLGEVNNCFFRKTMATNFSNPDYVYIKFSTKGKTGLKVSSFIGSDNSALQVQKMQYSLDGKTYVDFATDTLSSEGETAFNVWTKLAGNLPETVNDKDSVLVRWIADPSSTQLAVASSDKTFEIVYISKIVVLADKDMGGTSWRVDPLDSYTAGQVISSVPGITLTLGGGTNVWSVSDSTFTFDKATYVAGLNGNTNPVDGNGKKFSASGVPPTVGAFYKFDAAVDGTLDAAIIINSGKNSYIVEDATALIGYNPFTVAVKTYASYSIPVKTGKSYYFFSEASKMGIMGFVFKSQTGTVNPAQTANVVYTSAGVLYIKSAKADQAVVYDLLGKKILSTKLNEGLNEFSGLAHGSYIVKIGIETTKAVL